MSSVWLDFADEEDDLSPALKDIGTLDNSRDFCAAMGYPVYDPPEAIDTSHNLPAFCFTGESTASRFSLNQPKSGYKLPRRKVPIKSKGFYESGMIILRGLWYYICEGSRNFVAIMFVSSILMSCFYAFY